MKYLGMILKDLIAVRKNTNASGYYFIDYWNINATKSRLLLLISQSNSNIIFNQHYHQTKINKLFNFLLI